MPTFDIAVSKRIYLNVKVEADTAEEAQKMIEERQASGALRHADWAHFDPTDDNTDQFRVDAVEEGEPAPKRYPGMR